MLPQANALATINLLEIENATLREERDAWMDAATRLANELEASQSNVRQLIATRDELQAACREMARQPVSRARLQMVGKA